MPLNEKQTEAALEIANLFRNTLDRSAFVFAKAHRQIIKNEVEEFLKEQLDGIAELKKIVFSIENPHIIDVLLDEQKDSAGKTIFFVHGLDEIAQAEAAGHWGSTDISIFNALNYRRENLSDNNISFLMWVSDSTLEKLMHKSPDFWRFRDHSADFETNEPSFGMTEGIFITDSTPFGERSLEDLEKSLEIKLSLLNDLEKQGKENSATAAKLHSDIGHIHQRRSRYDQAMDHFQEALKINRNVKDNSGEGVMLNNIGTIYLARGDYDTALKYLKESLNIHRETGHRAGEGATLNGISQIYHNKGKYDAALKFLENSLKILREIGDRTGEGVTLNNISQIYHAKGDYDTALKYLEDSLKILREIGDRAGEGTTLNNIGRLYNAKGDYNTSLKYDEDSLKIRREIGDREGITNTLFNMSRTFIDEKNDVDKGMPLIIEAYNIAHEIGDAMGIFHTSKYLGAISLQVDKSKGLPLLMEALNIGSKMGLPEAKDVEAFIKKNYTEAEIKAFLEKNKPENPLK